MTTKAKPFWERPGYVPKPRKPFWERTGYVPKPRKPAWERSHYIGRNKEVVESTLFKKIRYIWNILFLSAFSIISFLIRLQYTEAFPNFRNIEDAIRWYKSRQKLCNVEYQRLQGLKDQKVVSKKELLHCLENKMEERRKQYFVLHRAYFFKNQSGGKKYNPEDEPDTKKRHEFYKYRSLYRKCHLLIKDIEQEYQRDLADTLKEIKDLEKQLSDIGIKMEMVAQGETEAEKKKVVDDFFKLQKKYSVQKSSDVEEDLNLPWKSRSRSPIASMKLLQN
jgi:hypothetical protein